jgi:DNA-binding NarL/FixJ family response regulator
MIRLFVIEDHNVTIAGLRTFFRPSRDPVQIVLTSASIEDALQVNDQGTFDIILLDLWLPKGEPVENFRRLTERFPGKPVVIYSAERAIGWQRKMYKAGAKGFINKDAEKSVIKDTLERVLAGETIYSAAMNDYQAKRVIRGYHDPKFGLTNEQIEVLQRFMDGMAPKEIAGDLGKDHSTINKILKHIREKFDVSNDVDLVKTVLNLDADGSLDSGDHAEE